MKNDFIRITEETGIIVPLVVMQARDERSDPLPVVIALADLGKQKFRAARPDAVSTWRRRRSESMNACPCSIRARFGFRSA